VEYVHRRVTSKLRKWPANRKTIFWALPAVIPGQIERKKATVAYVRERPQLLPSSPTMSAGLILTGRYRLISKLGQGGMGSVWRAEDMNLGAEVAVKLIDAAFAGSTDALKRFRREAQAAATIRSTYVVQILDHGIDNGTPFIAMELLKGESLAHRLEAAGKLSAEQTGRILGHVGRALALAHEHGIVHRDMKPENIFLVREDDDDVGKVLDFGIARQSGGLADSGGLKTQTGAILGTPFYMSPEQATGQAVDPLTDIWSFGVIASECLTGRRTFDSESLGGLFHAICMLPLPVPSQLGEVPAGFDAWFARAVARERPARFQSIKEAADGLRALCGRTSGRPSAVSYSAERGDKAQSSQVAAPGAGVIPARPAVAAGMQTTAVPSSRSIPGLSKTRRPVAVLIAASVTVIVVAGIAVGWHWMSRGDTTDSAASVALSATAAAAQAQSTAHAATEPNEPSAIATAAASPQPTPIIIEIADAGRDPDKTPNRAILTPQRAFPTSHHAAPTTAKDPPPAASVKKPSAPPQKRDDNAAGI
jgi:serine/threonine-protein kinase